MIFPPSVKPGSVIRVIAPSGAVDRTAVEKALAWLAQRYTVRLGRHTFCRHKYLAGTDDQRFEDLHEALVDPESAAIVCARGGFGCTRLLARTRLTELLARPQWIVGFSDITALHLSAQRQGIASIHADNLQSLAQADAQQRQEWLDALERPQEPRTLSDLVPLQSGLARGTLVGGTLALLHDAAASNLLRLPEQSVLFLEDVGERPYRIDRMLTALRSGGHLAKVCAVCLGSFTGTSGDTPVEDVYEAVLSVLHDLNLPIVAGIPAGHGERNTALVLGATCEVSSKEEHGTLRMEARP